MQVARAEETLLTIAQNNKLTSQQVSKIEHGKTIHEISSANGKEPMELFEAIRTVTLKE